jgi:hypothetical protein
LKSSCPPSGVDDCQDVFVAKFTPEGEHLWSRTVANIGDQQSTAGVAVDDAGRIYVTGSFVGTTFVDIVNVTSAGGSDAFMATYSAGGTSSTSRASVVLRTTTASTSHSLLVRALFSAASSRAMQSSGARRW